jgi:hypothetical protein
MPPFLSAIIDWLRAGYPDGVPESDYIPLLTLLRRRVSDDEVRRIATELADTGDLPTDTVDIGVMITKITNDMPSETDISRVRARLAAFAWLDPEHADGAILGDVVRDGGGRDGVPQHGTHPGDAAQDALDEAGRASNSAGDLDVGDSGVPKDAG